MAKTKAQKSAQVAEYSQRLQNYTTFFVVKPLGVNPNESTKLKKELSKLGSSYNVVKNTLFKVALKDASFEGAEFFDHNEHAVIFADGKTISESAKAIQAFVEDTKKAEIVGGVLDNKVIAASQVEQLAKLPSKDVMIAQFLNVINAPMTGLVRVLNGNIQEFLYALNAIKEAKS